VNVSRLLRLSWRPPLAAITAAVLIAFTAAWYGWLGIPDSTGFYLALQAVAALALLALVAWFYAGLVRVLADRSQGEEACLGELWRPGKRLWLTAVVLLVVLVLALFCVGWIEDQCLHVIWKVPSWLTYKLNHPVPIPPFVKAVQIIFAYATWGVLPALATMILAARRRNGGLWPGWRIAHRRWLWGATAVILIVLEYLPWRLAHWVPAMHSAVGELFSAIVRVGSAWILAVLGLLLLMAVWVGAVERREPK